jgi:uncharacterized damage-inducible protein DinB
MIGLLHKYLIMKEQVLPAMNEQLLSTLETSKNYTLAVAQAMPGNNYEFKPVESVWNFGELLEHIAYGIRWWEANFVKGITTDWAPPAANTDKQAIIENLTTAYNELEITVSEGGLSKDGIKGFHATLDHITHHRGQAVMYLRGNGVVPPEYTY